VDASFGSQLRAHRAAAELSQEALAEAARISTSAVEKYERGVRVSPHRETVALLADALNLRGQPRADFEKAARRKALRGGTQSSGSISGTGKTRLAVLLLFDNCEHVVHPVGETAAASAMICLCPNIDP
jgi:transcriptional regulator with XRE-family HTH domain